MTINNYQNFDLLVTRAGDQYRAFVVDAPAGEASAIFDPPFDSNRLPQLGSRGLVRGVRRQIGQSDDLGSTPDLTDLGQKLFEAIFQGEMHTVLATSLNSVTQEGTGLRLRLRFEEDAADLANLPWETLYDPDQHHFVGLGERSPILRYLSLPRSRSALLEKPPLRVLTLLASPPGLEPLDMDREWQAIQDALSGLVADGKFELERLEIPSLAALRERLRGEAVHILHFVGHGVFDESSQAGSLALEDGRGRLDLVQGDQLAAILRNHPALRLVYLNACEGALASGQSVFTGVAQTLVRGGVPAAVAMQAEITDSGAIELARTFYTTLAAGSPVDAALTQARVALNAAGSPEWAIPVLFSRSPDNRLFDLREVLPTPDCPYPGMAPFTEAQKDLFFGRDREIEDAVERLRQHPFLAVVGPSGSGKSSLIYAGVIPALRDSRRFGPGAWTIHTMRPGDSRTQEGQAAPGQALAQLLGCPADELAAQTFDHRTLLFVDQFEEVFTLAEAGEAQSFLDALQSLSGQPNLFILLTARADFYPDLMASSLWPPIRANRLELTPLGDEELWAAIVEPAARVGVTVDEALAVQLIADAAGESGVLPLVQETLVLLWDRVERRQLGLGAYRQMAEGGRSGLEVAIDRRASVVYENLSEAAQPIARRIFLRLIQFGEGRADTRRQQTVAELRASGDDPDLFDETLAALTTNRLLTASGEVRNDQDAETPPPTRRADASIQQVDIAHEALIAGWPRLQVWLSERRAAELTRRRLEEKAKEHLRLGKGRGLLDAYEVEEAEKWLAGDYASDLGTSQDLIGLVKASKGALAQAAAEKEGQRQRELQLERERAEAERLRAEEGERAAHSLRQRLVLAVLIGVMALVAAGAAGWFGVEAGNQRDKANAASTQAVEERDRAEKALVTATVAQGQAEIEAQNASDQRDKANAASTQAVEERDRAEKALVTATVAQGQAEIEAARAVEAQATAEWQREEAERRARQAKANEIAGYSFRDQNYALALAIAAARLTWDSDAYVTPQSSSALSDAIAAALADTSDVNVLAAYPCQWPEGHADWANTAAFSPNDRLIVSAGNDGTARVWIVDTGYLTHTLAHDTSTLVLSALFSPKGDLIVTAGSDRTARVWDVRSGNEIRKLPHESQVNYAAFSPNGQRVATVSNTITVWNFTTGEPVWSQGIETEGLMWYIEYMGSDYLLATDLGDAGQDGQPGAAMILSATTGTAINRLPAFGTWVFGAASNPANRNQIAIASASIATVVDRATGNRIFDLPLRRGVMSVQYSYDGQELLTANGDSSVTRWDAGDGHEIFTISLKQDFGDQQAVPMTTFASFSHDRQQVVATLLKKGQNVVVCEASPEVWLRFAETLPGSELDSNVRRIYGLD